MYYTVRTEESEEKRAFKVNINLDEELYAMLCNDAEKFRVIKKDGTANENGFINRVIRYYLGEYVDLMETRYETTLRIITEECPEMNVEKRGRIARNIAFSGIDCCRGSALRPARGLSLYVCADNRAPIYTVINRSFKDVSLSTFIREMLRSFMTLPVYRREQLIYADRIDTVEKAIRMNESVEYVSPGTRRIHHFFPAYIGHSEHEYFNYVVGQLDSENHTTFPIRIANMEDVYLAGNPAVFTGDFPLLLGRMKKNGIQFAIQQDRIYTVTLTAEGYEAFTRRYLERPVPLTAVHRDDGSVMMTFDCSEFQLNCFFRPFDGMIVDIEG